MRSGRITWETMRLNVAGAFFTPCGITSHSQKHITWRAHCCEGHVTWSHRSPIEGIGQFDGTIDDASQHGAQYHVFSEDRRLRQYGGLIQIFYDTPSVGGLLNTGYLTRMWKSALAHMTRLEATLKKSMDLTWSCGRFQFRVTLHLG